MGCWDRYVKILSPMQYTPGITSERIPLTIDILCHRVVRRHSLFLEVAQLACLWQQKPSGLQDKTNTTNTTNTSLPVSSPASLASYICIHLHMILGSHARNDQKGALISSNLEIVPAWVAYANEAGKNSIRYAHSSRYGTLARQLTTKFHTWQASRHHTWQHIFTKPTEKSLRS